MALSHFVFLTRHLAHGRYTPGRGPTGPLAPPRDALEEGDGTAAGFEGDGDGEKVSLFVGVLALEKLSLSLLDTRYEYKGEP